MPGSSMSRIWDYNFFFPFFGLSNLILPRNNSRKRFFYFLNFFAIFFGISLPWSCMSGIRDLNFFVSFLANLISFWLKIIAERGFLIFCYFFRYFLAPVNYERNSGLKFFSLFLGLSHPIQDKNNAVKRFFNFFAIFFGIFLHGSSMNGIWD